MKSLFSFSVIIVAFLSFFIVAKADGESVTPDAQTLVRQAITISTGLEDANAALEKAQLAPYAKGIDSLDKEKLNQAISYLKKSDLEQANKSLAEALKEDPEKTNVLEFKPTFKASTINTILIILSLVFIIAGVLVTRYAAKLPYKKNTSLQDVKPVA